MPEPGRQVVKEQLFIGGDGLPWDNVATFVELCVARAAHFYNMAAPGDGHVLFDRSMVDGVAALGRLGLSTPQHLQRALERYRYARTVFLTPPWPELFAGDGERRHSFEDAVAEYQGLLAAYPANGYRVVEIPRGTVDTRANFLAQRLVQPSTASHT